MEGLISISKREKNSTCFYIVCAAHLCTCSQIKSLPVFVLPVWQGASQPRPPCSGFLVGPTSKRHNRRGQEGRRRRKAVVFLPTPFYISSVVPHPVSWPLAPRCQLWNRIPSRDSIPVRQPLHSGSGNTTSSHSLSWS